MELEKYRSVNYGKKNTYSYPYIAFFSFTLFMDYKCYEIP